ncbi:MAG: citramalate synthase, partial [Chloroflexi bacterium]|nr:citramalate synthase [Chloroflexota bacterium]
HIEPQLIGNEQRSVVSELSGRGNLVDKARQFGLETESLDLQQALEQIKKLESQGFTFEGAEASVEMMLRRTHPAYVPPFEVIDYSVSVSQRRGRGLNAEAIVKVRVGPKRMHTVADGNGPVNALDAALRKALVDVFPQLGSLKLADYKVRILDGENATAATTRVLIDSRQGNKTWSTVGASTNIIEASWRALTDSMEYALLS